MSSYRIVAQRVLCLIGHSGCPRRLSYKYELLNGSKPLEEFRFPIDPHIERLNVCEGDVDVRIDEKEDDFAIVRFLTPVQPEKTVSFEVNSDGTAYRAPIQTYGISVPEPTNHARLTVKLTVALRCEWAVIRYRTLSPASELYRRKLIVRNPLSIFAFQEPAEGGSELCLGWW